MKPISRIVDFDEINEDYRKFKKGIKKAEESPKKDSYFNIYSIEGKSYRSLYDMDSITYEKPTNKFSKINEFSRDRNFINSSSITPPFSKLCNIVYGDHEMTHEYCDLFGNSFERNSELGSYDIIIL